MDSLNLRIVFGITAFFQFSNVFATENGASTYPLGADTFFAGALPPPGTYMLGYYQNYHASKFVDQNGDSSIPDFGLNVNVYVPRLVWVTDKTVFSGNLAFHIIQPLVDIRASAAGHTDSKFGFGDTNLATAIGWHHGSHNYTTGLEVTVPVGSYDKNKMANSGNNYSTIRPMIGYSYLDPHWDASTKITYNYNTENNDTNYKSGQFFAGDYNLSYRVFPNFAIGIQGYALKQVTGDKFNGDDIGFKGQVFGIGPGILYKGRKGWSIEARYITETAVENRPKGDVAWLRLVIPKNSLK